MDACRAGQYYVKLDSILTKEVKVKITTFEYFFNFLYITECNLPVVQLRYTSSACLCAISSLELSFIYMYFYSLFSRAEQNRYCDVKIWPRR